MNPQHDGPELNADPRELELTAFALDELDDAERAAVAERLAADPAARARAEEIASVADQLRRAHAASALPVPSPMLQAALNDFLDPTLKERLVMSKTPEFSAPQRRFTWLELVLALSVIGLAGWIAMLYFEPPVARHVRSDWTVHQIEDQRPAAEAEEETVSFNKLTVNEGLRAQPDNAGAAGSAAPGVDPAVTATTPTDVPDAASSAPPKPDGANHPTPQPIVMRLPKTSQGPGQHGQGQGQEEKKYAKRQLETSGYFYALRDGRANVDLGRKLGVQAGDADVRFGKGGKDEAEKLADASFAGDQYAHIVENAFKTVSQDPLSTFSIDVDTASYSKLRQHIMEYGQLPPPDAVRIEELINYFPYDYLESMDEHPFAAHMEVAQCPWHADHRLARIAIKGKEMKPDERPASNLVFLIDVSGSMNEANKLPLVIRGLEMLTRELTKNDRVAIVVYAGAAGLVLPSTSGDEQETILAALGKLQAGGSTAGAEGIKLAYQTAEENFITAGVNRVILCSDGDFNVGVSDTGSLVRLAEEQAKKNIFLSILGFGIGNLNDEMLEQVSNKANGMYAFIDTETEARKVLVEQMSGTLVTIAKDVKIQIEFNPAKVAAYRLIGYENRILAAEDFNDDKKDAGEIGAGHTVTALYEIVPVSAKEKPEIPAVDDLKYQMPSELTDAADSDELLTLKLRYKSPEGDKSTLLSEPVDDSTEAFGKVSDDFKFAAAVASFGMLLRGSEYSGDASYDAVLEIATDGAKHDKWGYRTEFLEIVRKAKELAK